MEPRPPHILVLDDDPVHQDLVGFALSHAGLGVSVALNSVKALALARRRHFDLVISDYYLPDYPGTDFIRLLRNCDEYKDIPVILLTARADELNRQRLQEDLFVLLLSKPHSSRALLTSVFKCLAAVRSA